MIYVPFASTGGDPYWSQVIWLLHCTGADGSTTFADSSPVGRADAFVSGNAQISGNKGLLDGSVDYISTATSETFTGEFCFEGQIKFAADHIAHQDVFGLYHTSTASERWTVYRDASTHKLKLYRSGTGDVITGTTSLSTGVEYFLAWARISGVHYISIDGTIEGSYSHSGTLSPTGIVIGAWLSPPTEYLDGTFDEIRVTNGSGRGYSSNFTPPTLPFPDR